MNFFYVLFLVFAVVGFSVAMPDPNPEPAPMPEPYPQYNGEPAMMVDIEPVGDAGLY